MIGGIGKTVEERFMSKAKGKSDKKQVVTIRLDENIVRKAQFLAARGSTSIEDLLARQIEILARQEEVCERAELQAAILLDQDFHLGGKIRAKRNEFHKR
jgi:hypothetical protein